MADKKLKVVIVGDTESGKTALQCVFVSGVFPSEYIPTVFDNFEKEVHVNGQSVHLGLWDTAGHDDYDRLRPLSYPGADVALICVSIDRPSSLDRVSEKWVPELRRHCRGIPIVLVGTKKDLREDEATKKGLAEKNEEPVKEEDGRSIAQKVGALGYFECSAKHNDGVTEVFEAVSRTGLTPAPH